MLMKGNKKETLAYGSQHPGREQSGYIGSWVRGSQYTKGEALALVILLYTGVENT